MNDKTVELSQEEFKGLLKQVADLTQAVTTLQNGKGDGLVLGANGTLMTKQKRERQVRVMFLDGKPVVGLENVGSVQTPVKVWEEPDPVDKRKSVLRANLMLLDLETKKVSVLKGVNFVEFVQGGGQPTPCKVKKVEKDGWELNQGEVAIRKVGKDTQDSVGHTEEVGETDAIVEGFTSTFTVEWNGYEFPIHQDYVNMK